MRWILFVIVLILVIIMVSYVISQVSMEAYHNHCENPNCNNCHFPKCGKNVE